MMFTGVEVMKVTTNSARDFIGVRIFSRDLIQKKSIYDMEAMLKEQLFSMTRIQVQILEDYELTQQYTPENLMNESYDSILL